MIRRVKKYEFVKATTRKVDELRVGGRRLKLDRNGVAYTYDAGLAREVEQKYGNWRRAAHRNTVVVNEVDYEDPTRERGHVYTFTIPELPWKKKRKRK